MHNCKRGAFPGPRAGGSVSAFTHISHLYGLAYWDVLVNVSRYWLLLQEEKIGGAAHRSNIMRTVSPPLSGRVKADCHHRAALHAASDAQ